MTQILLATYIIVWVILWVFLDDESEPSAMRLTVFFSCAVWPLLAAVWLWESMWGKE